MLKAVIRKSLRQLRQQITPAQHKASSQKIIKQLIKIPEFIEARNIAIYLHNDGEINLNQLHKWCLGDKNCYFPIIQKNSKQLLFGSLQTENPEKYHSNSLGILEPNREESRLISPTDLDIVLVPLVGFDQNGNRIGMGGGYYDNTFSFLSDRLTTKPMLIGVAHDIQEVTPSIQSDQWDIPLSIVVTDKRIILCKKRK